MSSSTQPQLLPRTQSGTRSYHINTILNLNKNNPYRSLYKSIGQLDLIQMKRLSHPEAAQSSSMWMSIKPRLWCGHVSLRVPYWFPGGFVLVLVRWSQCELHKEAVVSGGVKSGDLKLQRGEHTSETEGGDNTFNFKSRLFWSGVLRAVILPKSFRYFSAAWCGLHNSQHLPLSLTL